MRYRFEPRRVFFEEAALEYPLGTALRRRFQEQGTPVEVLPGHNRVSGLPGDSPRQVYGEAKRTLVVGVRRGFDFETCKPSAHYRLPVVTGCPGHCTYCYLQTTLGPRPFIRIYVNMDEVLARARQYIENRLPEETIFEGAATSDPVPVEHLSGALGRCIEFFAGQPHGRFRFVTKYDDVDSFLHLRHNGRTRIRFSLNDAAMAKRFELAVPAPAERIAAAAKIARAGYPLGFIIGPIIAHERWREGYDELLRELRGALAAAVPREAAAAAARATRRAPTLGARLSVERGERPGEFGDLQANPLDLRFELITHRFTPRAKRLILERYPDTDLPMDEGERQWKFGQFGYGKYLYPRRQMAEIETFFRSRIAAYFPEARVDYFI